MNQVKKVNVAPSSDEGHYIQNAINVIDLEVAETETFFVQGSSILTTKNHTDLKRDESCVVSCQRVYDPILEASRKSKD